jgi:LemA protein
MQSLVAVAENNPDLKAAEQFLYLQSRISGLEIEIADRREFYNENVAVYNTRLESMPDLMLAKLLGYKKEPLFEVTDEEAKSPNVENLFREFDGPTVVDNITN